MKFTVKRSRWLRGGLPDESALRVKGGKMCCVGFYALELGYKPKDILDVSILANLPGESEKFPKKSRHPKRVMDSIYECNDSEIIGRLSKEEEEEVYDGNGTAKKLMDERREEKLTKLFQKIGVTVKFVD